MARALITILFDGIEDPRVERTRRYKLTDVLLIALIGVVAGQKGWDHIADFAEVREKELSRLLELPNGTPSADTIRRVMSAVDTKVLDRALTDMGSGAVQDDEGQASSDRWKDNPRQL